MQSYPSFVQHRGNHSPYGFNKQIGLQTGQTSKETITRGVEAEERRAESCIVASKGYFLHYYLGFMASDMGI